ncbi:hypothetical protein SH601_13635 [Gracilibacillus sp. S3-1-1]|uniref:Uncharacterized protein n=1 Tax=Gracilibacillus pellucidus TaxID=3095368 RepID=A0ACC6M7Y4_9BACI|nr:hypothetical protein [Gracilibacillus sp. S3-1-1]MDX8047030.1 hypothetical protein [Gracilibacillus sp. S3-1-1]
MKRLIMLALLVCGAITLVSCQSPKERMTLLDTITEISISKSGGYGGIDENFFSSFSNLEITSAFEEIMKSAKLEDAKINEDKPDYDILVNYENGDTHLLHLILGDR